MKQINSGEFFGSHIQSLELSDIKIKDTYYTHEYVDWHYHEHPYFTFLLHGELVETNKKGKFHIGANELIFHNWDDAHSNYRPPINTRGFHIELTSNWFKKYDIEQVGLSGSMQLKHPAIIKLMHHILYHTKQKSSTLKTDVDIDLISTIDLIKNNHINKIETEPTWYSKLISILHDQPEYAESLTSLSNELDLHPVYLSRAIRKHLGMNLSEYLQLIKINKTITHMYQGIGSLTEIAYLNTYFDQSHFIKSFKKYYDVTPRKFMKSIQG